MKYNINRTVMALVYGADTKAKKKYVRKMRKLFKK